MLRIKNVLAHGMVVLFVCLTIKTICCANGIQGGGTDGYTGMLWDGTQWRYYIQGTCSATYTGMACNEYGWWYFQDGQLNWNYTGMACNEYGWWYFQDGQLNWNYTGMALNEYGWWYFQDGRLNWNYTGMALNDYGWWFFQKGFLNMSYNGLGENEYGEWIFENGKINFDYTGVYADSGILKYAECGLVTEYTGDALGPDGWVCFENGSVNNNYSGLGKHDGVMSIFSSGSVDTSFDGMYFDDSLGWKVFEKGALQGEYTGVAKNEYGYWYFSNGSIDWKHTGIENYNDKTIYFKEGLSTYTGMLLINNNWRYVISGVMSTDYTGTAENDWGYWYFTDGKLDRTYTGMALVGDDWKYYVNGNVDDAYTGMAENEYGWWYFSNGELDRTYEGLAKNQYGQWLIEDGTVYYDFTGDYTCGYDTYRILNGRVVGASNNLTAYSWDQSLSKMDYDADIAFYGDSLTADSDFASMFADLGKNIVELGLSGDTVYGMIDRVNMLKSVKPEKIFVMGGINELNDENESEVLAEYGDLLDEIHTQCPTAEIYVQSVLPVSQEEEENRTSNEVIVHFNNSLKDLTEEKGWTYIDLHDLFVEDGYMKESLTVDGTHLTGAGYTIWGDTIRQYIE